MWDVPIPEMCVLADTEYCGRCSAQQVRLVTLLLLLIVCLASYCCLGNLTCACDISHVLVTKHFSHFIKQKKQKNTKTWCLVHITLPKAEVISHELTAQNNSLTRFNAWHNSESCTDKVEKICGVPKLSYNRKCINVSIKNVFEVSKCHCSVTVCSYLTTSDHLTPRSGAAMF